jgi:hypothetical protein
MTTDISISRIYGGKGGYAFTDYNSGKVERMEVRFDDNCIRSISTSFRVKETGMMQKITHGGKEGTLAVIELELDEYIVSTHMSVGKDFVEQLTFFTNKSRKFGPYGKTLANSLINLRFNKQVLLGFTGRCDSHINALGIICGEPT